MASLAVHIGIDSVDSPHGGCTTHFASLLLVKLLKEKRVRLIDYPNLVRLNPAVPWKTRGNGSVALRFMVESESEARDIVEMAVSLLEEYLAGFSSGWEMYGSPSIAALVGDIPQILEWFSQKALYDIITLDLLERVLSKIRPQVLVWSEKKRGLIGCLAGIGYRMLNTDYTYEIIAYRSQEYIGTPRRVEEASVVEMDRLFSDYTILNYDYEENRPLITPHGPDPVLLGIRGEDPHVLVKAFRVLKIDEPVPLAVIYRTNQHTDAHLKRVESLSEVYPYRSVVVRARVSKKPRRVQGGHVIFSISDGSSEVDVAAYQPTGWLRSVVELLEVGDEVEVMGVVRPMSSRHGLTINLEKLHVIDVKPKIVLENPRCPVCGARMTSAGHGKGFKCQKCGFRSRELSKVQVVVERELKPGWYEPPPRAFKHLMKPLKRFGKEKSSFPQIFEPSNFIFIDNGKLLR